MTPLRTLLAGLLAVLGLFLVVPAAWAHTHLVSSSPAQGDTLSAAPHEVRLTFAEPVSLPADPISVTGPGGVSWKVGPATVAGAVITAPVTPSGQAGAYTLRYTVTADDGDAVTGTVAFALTAAAGPAAMPMTAAPMTAMPMTAMPMTAAPMTASGAVPDSSQPAERSAGVPAWVWVLAVVVIGGAAGAAIRLKLSR